MPQFWNPLKWKASKEFISTKKYRDVISQEFNQKRYPRTNLFGNIFIAGLAN